MVRACCLKFSIIFVMVIASVAYGQSALTPNTIQAEVVEDIAPIEVVKRIGDRSIILHWTPVSHASLAGYHVFRAASATDVFEQRTSSLLIDNHFVDVDVENGRTYIYRVRAIDASGQIMRDSERLSATPHALDDEAFIELVQQTAFDYFWYEANPQNGLIRDRNTASSPSSIAAVGFGLSALTVGIDRGWISRSAGRQRAHTTLKFLRDSPHGPEIDATGYKGFYYHFLDMQTGRRAWRSELSTIDTALLMSGVLHAQRYFDQEHSEEAEIRAFADALYRRVEWTWMQVDAPKISHGWMPETGFLPHTWGGYNEGMILYLLALGSPTFPVDEAAWRVWTSTYAWGRHYGQAFVVFPPLFGHQYSHIWIDFRGLRDAYMRDKDLDYFENSRRATLANRAYAIDNPMGWADYGENVWGLTASDVPQGYRARGAPPAERDDGTIAPTAPGGSFPFTPEESLAALRHMYKTYRTQIWGPYGFKDAFNPSANWFAPDHIGIDQGAILLMIENHRTGRIWNVLTPHKAIQRGLKRAGFVAVDRVAMKRLNLTGAAPPSR